MTRRPARRSAASASGSADHCTITVCRGCCCGTAKVPGIDHTAQLADLRALLSGVARVRAVDCLDACEQANVIVVQPSFTGRRVADALSGLAWSTTPTPRPTSPPG